MVKNHTFTSILCARSAREPDEMRRNKRAIMNITRHSATKNNKIFKYTKIQRLFHKYLLGEQAKQIQFHIANHSNRLYGVVRWYGWWSSQQSAYSDVDDAPQRHMHVIDMFGRVVREPERPQQQPHTKIWNNLMWHNVYMDETAHNINASACVCVYTMRSMYTTSMCMAGTYNFVPIY